MKIPSPSLILSLSPSQRGTEPIGETLALRRSISQADKQRSNRNKAIDIDIDIDIDIGRKQGMPWAMTSDAAQRMLVTLGLKSLLRRHSVLPPNPRPLPCFHFA